MTEAISRVKTGQVTYAVRDTRIDDKEIHEGDIMGIGDAGILAVGKERLQVAEDMVAEMIDEEAEIISVYYGEDVSEADAEALSDALAEKYPECEVELNQGGQPIYYYLISVEKAWVIKQRSFSRRSELRQWRSFSVIIRELTMYMKSRLRLGRQRKEKQFPSVQQ